MIFKDQGAHLVGVPFEYGETNVAAMRAECEKARRENRDVKFVYVIPSFHNPTGGVMSLATRRVREKEKKKLMIDLISFFVKAFG